MDLFRGFKPRMHALFWVLLMDVEMCECGQIGFSVSCKACYEKDATNEKKAKMLDKIIAYFDNDAPDFEERLGKQTMMPLWKLLIEAGNL